MSASSSWRRGRPFVFCDAFARARCGEVGWRLVQKQCARVQFFDALRLHWARGQRCCSVAVSAAISAGLLACSKLAGCPENLFSFGCCCERIFRPKGKGGSSTDAVKTTESALNFLLSLQRLAKSRSRAQITRLAVASIDAVTAARRIIHFGLLAAASVGVRAALD